MIQDEQGRLLLPFNRESDGLEILVDVSDVADRLFLVPVVDALIHQLSLDATYQAFKQEVVPVDVEDCLVVSPDEFAGKTLREANFASAISRMSETERNEYIKREVAKLHEDLDSFSNIEDLLESVSRDELEDDLDDVETRGPLELHMRAVQLMCGILQKELREIPPEIAPQINYTMMMDAVFSRCMCNLGQLVMDYLEEGDVNLVGVAGEFVDEMFAELMSAGMVDDGECDSDT